MLLRLRPFAAAAVTAVHLIFIAGATLAAPTFPTLTGRVVDDANIIPVDVRTELDSKLSALEAKTTDQLVIVTLPSLQGYEVADYGYQLGRAWGIGQEGKDNGVLLIVAPNDRQVRIEVGYGLEGDLTDAVTRLIIENAILPRFRANDYPGGIRRGVDDIIQVLSGDAEAFKERAAKRPEPEDNFTDYLIILGIVLAFWIIAFYLNGGPRRGPWGGTVGPGGFSGGSGGWSSGSSGGGFSGGGGSFGGGGSSGRW